MSLADKGERLAEAVGRTSAPRVSPERTRDTLIVALTLVTGATDAIGFIRLGGVFTSVMTGNMVLMGVAAGKGEGTLAVHTGVAFVSYVFGSLVGGGIAGRPESEDRIWPRPVTLALCVEFILFAAFAIGYEAAGAKPLGTTAYALLGLNAVALGVMSGAVLRFGIPGLSTTYLTGTLTTVVARLGSHRSVRGSGRNVALLLGLVAGASLGATLAFRAPRAAPLVQLAVLGTVIVASWASFHDEADRRVKRRARYAPARSASLRPPSPADSSHEADRIARDDR